MFKKLNRFMLLLVIVAVTITSTVRVTPVYADDGGTEPVTEESAAPPGGEAASPDEGSAPQEPAAEAPPPEPVAEEDATEQPAPVLEALEQLPEETELVVINDEGEVEPLATAEAAEIIATGDPIWCSATAPIIGAGEVGCTGSHGTFQDLIITLAANPALYSGDGTIWVEDSYDGNDDLQIELNGDSLSGLRSGNLTIQGGWAGGTTVSGRSTADVSMIVNNWAGNITIRNFDINSEDDAGFGLRVLTQGSITLSDVSVTDTELNPSGFGDGADLASTGNGTVTITNGDFNQNAGNGLLVNTGGAITLTDVTASQNRLTGASLDSGGAVNIAGGSQFNQNGSNTASHGLVVHAGGGITVNNVEASNNALRGASLTSAQDVLVGASTFSGNIHAIGLYVRSGGSVTIDGVYSYSNNMGAQLYTTGAGGITIDDSNFGMNAAGDPLGNTATGLHAESGDAITLDRVISAYNGRNGGYLVAQGAINVTTSTFNSNVHGSYPEDPGLYAKSSGGNITLNHVYARENEFGAGVVLNTSGAGVINVINNSIFNSNGTFGVQAQTEDGNITLNGVIANFNQVKGAYLGAFSAGDIIIEDSTFVENGSYGIYAFTNEGDIDLDTVFVFGSDGGIGPGADDFTDYGAVLDAGGNVNVSNSEFNLNTDVGLGIISGGQVNLINVTAGDNGGNGIEVYSITTAGPICSGEQPVNIVVTVDAGEYTNNGGYGLMAKPGPGGTLTFSNPADFGAPGIDANDLGDYLIDLSQEFKDCTSKPKEEKPDDDGKGPLIVEVPFTGGPTVAQDCDQYTGTILKLPDGTWVKIGCPFEGFSHLEEVLEENLPTPLGAGIDFLAGIVLGLTDGQGNLILNEDGTVTISFAIPEGSRAGHHSILFWDETLNDGKGGWVELPPYEVGTSFALHPDNPEDGRTILSGVKRVGNVVRVTVNFSGTFVLVER